MSLKDVDFWIKLDLWMSKRPRLVCIVYDSLRIFLLEHCTIRATALVYTSLLAAVPLIILLTSISLYLGVGDLFITHIPELLPDVLAKIMPHINAAIHIFLPGNFIELDAMVTVILENIMPFLTMAQGIRLGSLGIIGGLGLLVTFILAIDTIETNMNIVWGVNESRGYGQKAAIFIPFLLLFAGGIAILSLFLHYMQKALEDVLSEKSPFGEMSQLLIDLSIPAVLLLLAIFALWLLYCYMPYVPGKKGFLKTSIEKTKTRWFAALVSAAFTFVAISVFVLTMAILQAGMFTKWSLFYGSLAVFPMIMFMLFGFWSIVLFGNTLCWRITDRKDSDGKYRSQRYFLRKIWKASKRQ